MPLSGRPGRRLPPVLRRVPSTTAGRRTAHRSAHRTAGAVPGHPPGRCQWIGNPRSHCPGENVNAHPAGPRHAEETRHASTPPRPQSPEELLRLAPNVWPRNTIRDDAGVAVIADIKLTELAQEYGTPLFVIDEDDFRSRCRETAAAFGGGVNVHYAAKAFLCSEIARWIEEEGLSLDVCTGGDLAVALHANFPPERITFHGNNKSVSELTTAVKAGVSHVVVDSMTEIERLETIAAE